MTHLCESCGTPVTLPLRRGGGDAKRWCSAYCRKYEADVRRRGRRAIKHIPAPEIFVPSALNVATSRAYAACQDRHLPSRDWIVREIGGKDHVMPLCSICEVPIPARYQLWNGKISENGYNGSEAA